MPAHKSLAGRNVETVKHHKRPYTADMANLICTMDATIQTCAVESEIIPKYLELPAERRCEKRPRGIRVGRRKFDIVDLVMFRNEKPLSSLDASALKT